MNTFRMDLVLAGSIRGELPDAHQVMSALYTRLGTDVELLENTRVSTLLPRLGEKVFLPVPVSDDLKKEDTKDAKRGRLFKYGELLARFKENRREARNAIDRITSGTALYFVNKWTVVTDDKKEVREFSVILFTDLEEQMFEKIGYISLGGKKNTSNVLIVEDVKESDIEVNTTEGLLLSTALPSDIETKHYPIVKRKHIYYEKEDPGGTKKLYRRDVGLYVHGSVLEKGEYKEGDIEVSSDKRIFVRPLFVEVGT